MGREDFLLWVGTRGCRHVLALALVLTWACPPEREEEVEAEEGEEEGERLEKWMSPERSARKARAGKMARVFPGWAGCLRVKT